MEEEEEMEEEELSTYICLNKPTMKPNGSFEDLYIWRDAISLAKDIFVVFDDCPNQALRWQIERASISISANIAEGFELGSVRQFVRHLYIAKGSCGEVRSLLYFAIEGGIFQTERLQPLIEKAKKLSIMIYNLIKSKGGDID